MSIGRGEADPSTFVRVLSKPGVFSGIPAVMAAFFVLSGPTSSLSWT